MHTFIFPFVRSSVCSFVRLSICPIIVVLLVRSFVHPFVLRSFVCSLSCSYARSSIRLFFVHSLVRSFACLTAVSFLTILELVFKYTRCFQSLAVVVMPHSRVKLESWLKFALWNSLATEKKREELFFIIISLLNADLEALW